MFGQLISLYYLKTSFRGFVKLFVLGIGELGIGHWALGIEVNPALREGVLGRANLDRDIDIRSNHSLGQKRAPSVIED